MRTSTSASTGLGRLTTPSIAATCTGAPGSLCPARSWAPAAKGRQTRMARARRSICPLKTRSSTARVRRRLHAVRVLTQPSEPGLSGSGMLAAPRRIAHGVRGSVDPNRLRTHRQARPLVGITAPHLPRARLIRDLHDVGGLPGPALRLRKLHLAVLLAGAVRRCSTRLVRTKARLVAHVAALHAGNPDPLGTGRVPAHLLLLPRRLLQGVLGGSALVRGGRAAFALPRRGLIAAH